MRKRKTIILLLAGFMLLASMASLDVYADTPTVKATGTLTSIEGDGSVIIDEKGYEVDPSATIINRKGKSVSLLSLSLPAKVRFEYVYAKEGFIIMFMGEVKNKEVKTKRRQQ